jgi:hypothetical protein
MKAKPVVFHVNNAFCYEIDVRPAAILSLHPIVLWIVGDGNNHRLVSSRGLGVFGVFGVRYSEYSEYSFRVPGFTHAPCSMLFLHATLIFETRQCSSSVRINFCLFISVRVTTRVTTMATSTMLRAVLVWALLLLPASAFLGKNGLHRKSSSPFSLSANTCPEIALTPRPGNEIAIVACG